MVPFINDDDDIFRVTIGIMIFIGALIIALTL